MVVKSIHGEPLECTLPPLPKQGRQFLQPEALPRQCGGFDPFHGMPWKIYACGLQKAHTVLMGRMIAEDQWFQWVKTSGYLILWDPFMVYLPACGLSLNKKQRLFSNYVFFISGLFWCAPHHFEIHKTKIYENLKPQWFESLPEIASEQMPSLLITNMH